jgi:hypothetical protein
METENKVKKYMSKGIMANPIRYPELEDEKLAELVGILLGDGCLGIYNCKFKDKIKQQHRTKITLNSKDDFEYSKYISNIFNHLFGVNPLIRIRKNEDTLDILTFRREILHFLLDAVGLKISPKWNTAEIPQRYLNGSLALHVLRGYLDTDGCVTLMKNNGKLYPRLEMKICPSPMQSQFIQILRDNGFKFKVYNLDKNKISVHICGKKGLSKWSSIVGFSNPKNIQRAALFTTDN